MRLWQSMVSSAANSLRAEASQKRVGRVDDVGALDPEVVGDEGVGADEAAAGEAEDVVGGGGGGRAWGEGRWRGAGGESVEGWRRGRGWEVGERGRAEPYLKRGLGREMLWEE